MTKVPAQSGGRAQYARKVTRLPGFDYASESAYFVTLVTKDRQPLFGEIVDEGMVLSDFGRIVEFTWNDLVNHNSDLGLGEFVIMPNHIHGIIHLYGKKENSTVGVGSQPTPVLHQAGLEPASTKSPSLSEIVRQLKTFSARRINTIRKTPGISVWQRNFYDHIIGTDREYEQIEEYILDNPRCWAWDEENRLIR